MLSAAKMKMTRKPVTKASKDEHLQLPSSGSNLPYPVTPTSGDESSDGEWDDAAHPLHKPATHIASPERSPSTLEKSDTREVEPKAAKDVKEDNGQNVNAVPLALRPGEGRRSTEKARDEGNLPESLRVGPSRDPPQAPPEQNQRCSPSPRPIWMSAALDERQAMTAYQPQSSSNPYLRSQNTGSSKTSDIGESSANAWMNNDGVPTSHGDEKQPKDNALSDTVSGLSMFDPFSPFYSPFASHDSEKGAENAPEPLAPLEELGTSSSTQPRIPASRSQSASSTSHRIEGRESVTSIVSHRTNSSVGWDPGADVSTFDAWTSRGQGLPGVAEDEENHDIPQTWEQQQEKDRLGRERRAGETAAAFERAQKKERERLAEEEWFQGEQDALNYSQSAARPPATSSLQTRGFEAAPALPPRPSGEASRTETAAATTRRKTTETYQIKHITWLDVNNSPQKMRKSPILLQNANGPCPLLALVNALTLSTPPGLKTSLIETLRLREQVSLGLLLDAVFDELMSGRRGDAAQGLPDVGELYSFLLALHTGMNVNPRFIPLAVPAPNIMDIPLGDPLDAGLPAFDQKLGGFENSRELRLYGTFSVPLIHGWLPEKDEPAERALRRAANTYEDSQNLMFREEELEDKLHAHGLNDEEQQLLEDISTIKAFLTRSATQLTQSGLDRMTKSLQPGAIAILFRNDHFSTLYKHPQSAQLLTLVTDMGYAGHEEVVWESLVDVNGENCEFFSGDFRPVGNLVGGSQPSSSRAQPIRSLLDDEDGGWTTVDRRSKGKKTTSAQSTGVIGRGEPASGLNTNYSENESGKASTKSREQEDHDLALAMQLQEEEEDRNRRETEARRREENLSRQFLSQETVENPPQTPPRQRRGSRRSGQTVGPLVPPATAPQVDGPDAPPPSYEQAASTRPFIPSPDHPAFTGTPASRVSSGRQTSAYTQNSSNFVLPAQASGVNASRRPPTRVSGVRDQARALLNEVQQAGAAAPAMGVRRRQSGGITPNPAVPGDVQRDKDCIVM